MPHKLESEEEISLNLLIILFFLGLLILFGTYFTFFDKEKYGSYMVIQVCGYVQNVYKNLYQNVYKEVCGYVQKVYKRVCEYVQNNYRFLKGQLDKLVRSVSRSSLRNHFLSAIHTSNSDSFEFRSCADCTITAQFEKENNLLKVEYNIPYNKNKISIFIHKILERTLDIPVDYGWISINFKPSDTDWSRYSGANFFVKGDGEPIKLEFSIWESDGDAWYFFDEKVLKTKNEVLVNMPFKDFVHPSWAPLGDSKKEFKNVTMFQMTITSFDKAVNNTLYFKLKEDSLIYLE